MSVNHSWAISNIDCTDCIVKKKQLCDSLLISLFSHVSYTAVTNYLYSIFQPFQAQQTPTKSIRYNIRSAQPCQDEASPFQPSRTHFSRFQPSRAFYQPSPAKATPAKLNPTQPNLAESVPAKPSRAQPKQNDP